MAKRMRPGKVISLRINPKDCMSIVDVCKLGGFKTEGMSFAMMASLAYSSAMQTLRDAGIIPDREGWEYGQIMAGYAGKSNAKKVEITKAINSLGSDLSVKGLSASKPEAPPVQEMSPEHKSAWKSFKEMCEKKELSEQPGSGVVWSASDQAEYDRLAQQV